VTPEVVPQGGSLTCPAETVNVRQDVPMSRSRTLIGLLWIIVAVLVWLAVLTAATLVTGYLGDVVIPRFDHGRTADWLMIVGVCAGMIGGVQVCRSATGWVQRRRLRRLRRRGSSTLAQVERLDVHHFCGRGAYTRYTVWLSWSEYRGARVYRFDGKPRPDFAAEVTAGTPVTVRYPAGRPYRFVIDIPYVASMVDQFA